MNPGPGFDGGGTKASTNMQQACEIHMESKNGPPQPRGQTVNQAGADVAMQVMLMMLFASVSRLADDSDLFQRQLRDRLLDLTEVVTLPPGSQDIEDDIRTAARTVISNVFAGAGAIRFPDGPA